MTQMFAALELEKLVNAVAACPGVRAIGRTGRSRSLPEPGGEGDIDVFVYCSAIPTQAERATALESLGRVAANPQIQALTGGNWGVGDCLELGGVETWVMYFTLDQLWADVESILHGDRLKREDDAYYYPVGRLAMLLDMAPLYDPDGLFPALTDRLREYPEALVRKSLAYHLPRVYDEEDFGRACSRKDVLFYHFVLDLALDHFLQALFALNQVYFPSRKRSLALISAFGIKPANCEERLLRAIQLGGTAGTIPESCALWRALSEELTALAAVK